ADARDLESRGKTFLAGDIQDLFPFGAMKIAPLFEGWVEPNFVQPRFAQAAHVLAAAGDTGVKMGVVVLAELVLQQREISARLFHRFLGFAAGDRRPESVHLVGFRDDVLVGFDFAFVGVDLRDVLSVLAERTVKTVALVAIPVDEQHHLPALGALFTALRDHLLSSLSARDAKSIWNRHDPTR